MSCAPLHDSTPPIGKRELANFNDQTTTQTATMTCHQAPALRSPHRITAPEFFIVSANKARVEVCREAEQEARAGGEGPEEARRAQRAQRGRTWSEPARTCSSFEMPRTKQIESRMLDLPLPFRPVMALNCWSKPVTTVRLAYDLKPSIMISSICMAARHRVSPESSRHPHWAHTYSPSHAVPSPSPVEKEF